MIRTGGKEYKLAIGDVLEVERLDGEVGATVELREVLLAFDGDEVHVGCPLVDGALVRAEVLDQGKAPKVVVFKMKRRKGYRRMRGHRQKRTVLRVTDIEFPGRKKARAPEAEKPAAKAAKKPAREAPSKAKPPAAKKREAAEKKPRKVETRKKPTGAKAKPKEEKAREKGKAEKAAKPAKKTKKGIKKKS